MSEQTAQRFVKAVQNCAPTRRERAIKLRCSQRQIEAYERREVPRLIDTLARLEAGGVITINDESPRCPCGAHAAEAVE